MAVSSGTLGSVTVAGTATGEIKEWSFNVSSDTVDVSAFGDSWREFIPSLRGATGSFSGNTDTSDAQQTALRNSMLGGSAVALRLYVNATKYWNVGTAYLTGMNPTTSYDGVATTSWDFQVSGAVTFV